MGKRLLTTQGRMLYWFRKLNRELWGGAVPTPRFIIRDSLSIEGHPAFGLTEGVYTKPKVKIFMPRIWCKATFMHECVHAWEWWAYENLTHGRLFKGWADQIRTIYGEDIE